MLSLLILTSALVTGAPEVEVKTADGAAVSGKLATLSADRVGVETADGPREWSAFELQSVVFTKPSATSAATSVEVELIDGSRLAGIDFHVHQGKALVSLAADEKIEVPTSAIRWARFRDSTERDEKQDRQWNEILQNLPAGDLLVTRKKASIDYLEGVLGDLDADAIQFQLDGESVPVKRPKIAGLVYFHAAAKELPAATCRVKLDNGSVAPAQTLALDASKLRITTPAGVELNLDFSRIDSINFSAGNTQYLSDLKPESVKFAPYFGLKEGLAALDAFYQPRADIGWEQKPLRLDGQSYSKGLALHSRTTVVYRLPEQYRHFKALVGIDDAVRDGGNVRVEIKGDSKSLWQATVTGKDHAQPVDLDLSGVKRLEIFVDYGDELDIGDYLDLCEARLTK